MVKKGIIILLVTLAVLFGGKYGIDFYKNHYSVMSKVSFQEVKSLSEMQTIINENDVVYVYMGRPNCGDSQEFEKYFPDMMKENNIDNLYYFNIMSINSNYEESNQYKTIISDAIGLRNTPTLAKYENGELVLISEWTTENGYSKEMAQKFIDESGIAND